MIIARGGTITIGGVTMPIIDPAKIDLLGYEEIRAAGREAAMIRGRQAVINPMEGVFVRSGDVIELMPNGPIDMGKIILPDGTEVSIDADQSCSDLLFTPEGEPTDEMRSMFGEIAGLVIRAWKQGGGR